MINLNEMRHMISHYTKVVFDNHESFLGLFSTINDLWMLRSINFGEDSINVIYILQSGQHISDSLEYSIFEKWYETHRLQISS